MASTATVIRIEPTGSRARSVRRTPPTFPPGSAGMRRSSGRGNHHRASPRVSSPIGTLTRKVRRQPKSGPPSLISSPPITGPMPTATPTMEPKKPKARPRSAPRKYCWIMPTPCGLSRPDPTPWTNREAFSHSALGAALEATEARVKMATPMMKIPPRPTMSPARPAATSTTPKVSAYPESTHCRSALLAPSPSWMEGSVTLTMLTPIRDMKMAPSRTMRMRQRAGSGASCAPSGTFPADGCDLTCDNASSLLLSQVNAPRTLLIPACAPHDTAGPARSDHSAEPRGTRPTHTPAPRARKLSGGRNRVALLRSGRSRAMMPAHAMTAPHRSRAGAPATREDVAESGTSRVGRTRQTQEPRRSATGLVALYAAPHGAGVSQGPVHRPGRRAHLLHDAGAGSGHGGRGLPGGTDRRRAGDGRCAAERAGADRGVLAEHGGDPLAVERGTAGRPCAAARSGDGVVVRLAVRHLVQPRHESRLSGG